MKKNILIVEDDLAMRIIIKKTLIESSVQIDEIYEAGNGKEGLEMLEVYRIDLILVDIYMPVMDGMEMLDNISDHSEFCHIPAIVISTENDEKRIDTIVKNGFGFIHKPFTQDLLEDYILKLEEPKK
jgi:two-component system, chemotaxis family, chemotaxis protein CheY